MSSLKTVVIDSAPSGFEAIANFYVFSFVPMFIYMIFFFNEGKITRQNKMIQAVTNRTDVITVEQPTWVKDNVTVTPKWITKNVDKAVAGVER